MRALLPLFLALAACAGPNGTSDGDSAGTGEFCSTLGDGGVAFSEAVGGNETSGLLSLRVLTDQSADPKDPLYVAFKSYTLENIDSGGVKTLGKTTGDGLVSELLGAGNWAFSAAYTRGSLTCLAQMEVLVEANSTTYGCPVMTCP
jgi:hypothetical protein